MALLQLGPLASAVAGSLAGTTIQRGRAGFQLRTKPLPTLRRTYRTNPRRQLWQDLSRRWALLTQPQRDLWQSTAESYPWLNRFGDPIRASGFWLYMRLNSYNFSIGSTFVASPSPPPLFPVVTLTNFIYVLPDSLVFRSLDPDPVPSEFLGLVYTSAPVSPGLFNPRTGYRLTSVVQAGAFSSPDITRDYTLAHRVLPDPSRACHTLFRFVHKGTGWPGPLFASQATI